MKFHLFCDNTHRTRPTSAKEEFELYDVIAHFTHEKNWSSRYFIYFLITNVRVVIMFYKIQGIRKTSTVYIIITDSYWTTKIVR